MGKRLRTVFIVLSLSGALFLCLEIVVRVVVPQDVRTATGDSLGLVIPDTILGHQNRAGAIAQQVTPEYRVTYTVDERGFRASPHSIDAETADATVLVVGDSFTFGVGSDDDETWPRWLEKSLNRNGRRVRVLNAGVPGYDTRREVVAIERLLLKVQPDWVLLAFLPNDLFSLADNTGRPAVVPRGTKSPPLHILILIQRLLLNSDGFYVRAYRSSGRAAIFETQPSQDIVASRDSLEVLLARAARLAAQAGARFAAVSIPQQFQVLASRRSDDEVDIDERVLDDHFSAVAASNGFDWIATLDTLVSADSVSRAPLFFRYDGHLTPTGNRIVGSYVAERLLQLMQ